MIKKGSVISLFVWILLAFGAQAQQTVSLKGQIAKPQDDSIMVVIYTNSLINQEQVTAAALDPKGNFTMNIPIAGVTIAEVIYGDEVASLFLEPGYDLTVTGNGGGNKDFMKSLKYTGKGSSENNFLNQYQVKFIENEGYQVLPDNIQEREIGFTEFVDYNKNDQYKFYNAYLKNNQLSAAFKTFIKAEIDYTWANDKITYADLRERVISTEPRIVLSPNYYSFVNKVSVNNPEAMLSPAYQTYLRNYITHLVAADKHKKTDADYFKVCYDYTKQKLEGENRSAVIGYFIKEAITKSHLKYTEEMIKELASLNLKQPETDYLLATYTLKKKFAPGSPAPDFKLLSINGDSVSLSSFKGKIVYLSFWNTTCGLCLMDMPFAQQVSEKMKDENIVFLQVAIDEDINMWKAMVKKKNLGGVHVYAKGATADVVKQYNLQDFPAYFLIGEDGTFLNTKANRPSSHAFEKELLTALK